MSHMSKIETEYRDLDAIKMAAKRLGWAFVEGATTYRWYGRFVGDSPMPEGLTQQDLGKCEHKIVVPGADYEVGFRRNAAGNWQAVWDWFQSGGLHTIMGKDGSVLKQAYGIEKAKMEARKKGYSIVEKKLPNGTIQLKCSK